MSETKKRDEAKPWMIFEFNPKCQTLSCRCCGYFWGPGNELLQGQRVVFNKARDNE